MTRLENLRPGMRICGLEPEQIVEVIQVEVSEWIEGFRDAPSKPYSYKVVFQRSDGSYDDKTLFCRDDHSFTEAIETLVFGEKAKLGCLAWEARRIKHAHLYDQYHLVFSSGIEPLPHQIEAVYGKMLGRHPLRYLLADDPGAGKTIMAGLLIRELVAREVVRRCLIIVPGNLVDQWQEELRNKFRLVFEVCDFRHDARTFNDRDMVIARMDQAKRVEYRDSIAESDWDLIVCDEAHKMSASYSNGEIDPTQRYQLGKLLSQISTHYLLMTATPHNGKEEEFQLFLRLLDEDRFERLFREGVRQIDTSDLVLRRIKEDLVTLDNKRLFPERKAYTANYALSDIERELYEAVTKYCREEFNRAERLEHARRNTVGFALTILQRRLASSPEAIYQSLKSRRQRLEQRRSDDWHDWSSDVTVLPKDEDLDEITASEREALYDNINDGATAARNRVELERKSRRCSASSAKQIAFAKAM